MSFDLLAYAKEHRYRVRNLHDGYPLLPLKPKGDHKSVGYVGHVDRHDAIIGEYGYVDADGNPGGMLGWYLVFETARGLAPRIAKIEAAGGKVTQEGDFEAAGFIPVAGIEVALKAIKVYRIPLRNPSPTFGAEPARFLSPSGRQDESARRGGSERSD